MNAQQYMTPEQEQAVAKHVAHGMPHRQAIKLVVANVRTTGLLNAKLMQHLGRVIRQYEAEHNLKPAA